MRCSPHLHSLFIICLHKSQNSLFFIIHSSVYISKYFIFYHQSIYTNMKTLILCHSPSTWISKHSIYHYSFGGIDFKAFYFLSFICSYRSQSISSFVIYLLVQISKYFTFYHSSACTELKHFISIIHPFA